MLRQDDYGHILVPLVATMFSCTLRVGEAIALTSDDLDLNFKDPSLSIVRVKKALKFPRRKGAAPYINQYKNAEFEEQEKVLPVVPELFSVLVEYGNHNCKGILFHSSSEAHKYLTYKFVQYRMEKYLKALGWNKDVTSSHFCRHGGAAWFYNLNGNKRVAGQMLGDKSDAVIDGYIKEFDHLAEDFVRGIWGQHLQGDEIIKEVGT